MILNFAGMMIIAASICMAGGAIALAIGGSDEFAIATALAGVVGLVLGVLLAVFLIRADRQASRGGSQ